MKKLKGFNFAELLLVLITLGIIISLTFPLLRQLKDDDKVYAAYKHKAEQDITDATSLVLLKNRIGFTGVADSDALRTLYTTNAMSGTDCADADNNFLNNTGAPSCGISWPAVGAEPVAAAGTRGVKLERTVVGFNYNLVDTDASGNPLPDPTYGTIYIDMNGDRGPNIVDEDRYTFTLYRDRAVIDQ